MGANWSTRGDGVVPTTEFKATAHDKVTNGARKQVEGPTVIPLAA
jgi:hypothetical protein